MPHEASSEVVGMRLQLKVVILTVMLLLTYVYILINVPEKNNSTGSKEE